MNTIAVMVSLQNIVGLGYFIDCEFIKATIYVISCSLPACLFV